MRAPTLNLPQLVGRVARGREHAEDFGSKKGMPVRMHIGGTE